MNADELTQRANEFVNFNKEVILDFTRKFSQGYRDFLYKDYIIVLGCMIYICYVVIALIFYYPSYTGCLSSGGTTVQILLGLLNAVFICNIAFFALKSQMGEEMAATYDTLSPPIMILVIVSIFIMNGYLYFKCHDPVCTSSTCESVDDATTYNKIVCEQVDKMSVLTDLETYYVNNTLPKRARIATCSNFYDASYRTDASMGKDGKGADFTCTPALEGKVKCNGNPDPAIGAPILAEFYVMTSNKTCVVNYQFDSYVSTKMIEIALNAGARCLDFDIFPLTYAKNAIPIVTIALDRGNYNMQHNYVTFKDCLATIVKTWFPGTSNPSDIALKDPLFLHLNIHPSMTKGTCDQIAILVRYYFNEFIKDKLLGPKYHYKSTNLGKVPMCELYGKVIIMVRQVGYPTAYRALTTSLDEITNALSYVSMKEKEWLDAKNMVSPEELINSNRRSLTYVRSSLYYYVNLSTEAYLGNSNQAMLSTSTVTTSSTSTSTASDDVTTMLLNKYTINNDPAVPVLLGCQFVAMNFQIVDDYMLKYLGFFRRTSFVLKPKKLRRKDVQYTPPVKTSYGVFPGVACSSESTDGKQNAAECKTSAASNTISVVSQGLEKSTAATAQRTATAFERPLFS